MPKISMPNQARIPQRIRHNEHINRRTTSSIFKAFDFAITLGCPLDTYIVINLQSEDDTAAQAMFMAIRHKYRDWLKYKAKKLGRPFVPVYVFSFENPDGHTHVNWVMHVPELLKKALAAKLPQWVLKVKGELRPFDIEIQPVTDKPKSLAKYIVKGTDPLFTDHFFLGAVQASQGWFRGKRAGVSPSLDKAARKAAGFNPRRRARSFWPTASALYNNSMSAETARGLR